MFEDIAAELEERTFGEGEILLEEGKETPNVYILKEGALVVTIEDDEVCRVCTPETVFGEVSVLLETESTATVKALEPTTVWVIEDLCKFMDSHPTFAKNVARELARRLCNADLNFLEVRASLQQLEERFQDQNADSKTTELSREDTNLLRLEAKNSNSQTASSSDATNGKRGQRIAIRGLLKKVNEILHKPIF